MTKSRKSENNDVARRKSQAEPVSPSNPTSQQQTVAIFKLEHYQGPLPPPELLREYDIIIPGGADRIVSQFEQQSLHRRELEKLVIAGDQARANWGLVCGTFVSVSALAVCGIAIFVGHPFVGLAGVIGTVASLAGVFVYGTNSRKNERMGRAAAQVPRKTVTHRNN